VKYLSVLFALTLQVSALEPKSAPADLVQLIAQGHLDAPDAWCRGVFRPGGPAGYAAAIRTSTGGRYVVLQAGLPAAELAPFAGTADVSCYTPARARNLSQDIRTSTIIQGNVAPRWTTTVICGFTDATTSVCWQYSPVQRRFVSIGGWVT
jgi:hypothetical protein